MSFPPEYDDLPDTGDLTQEQLEILNEWPPDELRGAEMLAGVIGLGCSGALVGALIASLLWWWLG